MMVLRPLGVITVLVLFLSGCQGASVEPTTTTEGSSLLSLPEPAPTTTVDQTTTTSQAFDPLSPPQYQIVSRTPVDGGSGDEIVVLLDPSSYESLTDIDIEDILAEVIELFPPVWIAHLIDDPAAANVVGNPDASRSELDAISDHYFARLDNGFEITFLGPFAESGGGVIGS